LLWHQSNYLIQLTVADEEELLNLKVKLSDVSVKHTAFREPDMDNQLTAICIAPGKLTKEITKKFKLL
jgi:hypothetical protein